MWNRGRQNRPTLVWFDERFGYNPVRRLYRLTSIFPLKRPVHLAAGGMFNNGLFCQLVLLVAAWQVQKKQYFVLLYFSTVNQMK